MVLNSRSNYMQASAPAGGDGEMISNGGFDDDTDWITLGGTFAFTGGKCNYDNVGGNGILEQEDATMNSSIEINTAYTLEFDIVNVSGLAYFIVKNVGGAITYKSAASYATNHHIVTFTTPADIGGGGIDFYIYADNDFSIDNISLIKD